MLGFFIWTNNPQGTRNHMIAEQAYERAKKAMADAYEAGYKGKPKPDDLSEHPLIEKQFLLGRQQAIEDSRKTTVVSGGLHG